MNIVKLISVCSRLASLNRFSMEHLSCPESVLEHTGMVAIVSMAIGTELHRVSPGCVDVGWIVRRALVHDMDELITGDLPRPTKYSSHKATALFEELSRTGIDKVARTMLSDWPGFAVAVSEGHAVAKKGSDGLVIKIADQIAVVYMVWREVIMRNNMSMVRQAGTVQQQLAKSRKLIDDYFGGACATFLRELIDQAVAVAAEAEAEDDPIHGIIREET